MVKNGQKYLKKEVVEMKKIIGFAKIFAKIFFGIDDPKEMRKRGLTMAVAIPAIRWMDWMLMGATATLVAFLKRFSLGDVVIFFVLWTGNIILSGAVVFANDKSGVDLTAMEAVRRLTDAAIAKSKVTGIILEVLIIFRLLIWDGPDQFIIFLRGRLNSKMTKILVFVSASGFQMAIWTYLYILGYENFTELFKAIIN